MSVTAEYDIVDIAQAVADELNAQSWSVDFTAKRGYLTLTELKSIGSSINVRVAPESLVDGDTITRGGTSESWGVSIAIAQKADTDDAVDTLVRLELAIRHHFDSLGKVAGATIDGTDLGDGTGLLYQTQLLHQANLFVGVLTLSLETR